MKTNRILIFVSILIFSQLSQAQDWMSVATKNKQDVNFYDVKAEFNTYWTRVNRQEERRKRIQSILSLGRNKGAETEEEKPGWAQFKRYEYFVEPRVFPTGNFPDKNLILNEWRKVQQRKTSAANASFKTKSTSSTANWTYLGTNNTIPTGNGGVGRVNRIRFAPNNSNIVYACTPAGGLWKSTNGGTGWTLMSDQMAAMGVTDIAINPENPNIIYLATGDGESASTGSADMYSLGVLKSTDGGVTWNTTGLSYQFSQTRSIQKLLINPINPDTVYAATGSGLQRTIDGGNTWTVVSSGSYKDVEFKPGDYSVVYGAKGTGVYKSTDYGTTFPTNITSSLMLTGASRCVIAVTAADPNFLYALYSKSSTNGFFGLYKSADGGATWTTMSSIAAGDPNLLGWYGGTGTDTDGQDFFTLALEASPVSQNTIYVGGVNVWKSNDGGDNWTRMSSWTGGGGLSYVHADTHSFDFLPGTGTIFASTDGGLYKSTNTGTSWTDVSAGMHLHQIYRLSTSATDPNLNLSGTQDNGTYTTSAPSVDKVLGGDGMECIIDYTNANIMYGSLYYGEINKTTNGWSSDFDVSAATDGAWVTPYVMHPTDHLTLYAGYTQIYKTVNGASSWTAMPGTSGGTFVALAIAPSNGNVVYAGRASQLIKTVNGGANWTTITGTLPISGNALTYIAVKADDPLTAWVTVSGFTATNKVFKTTDGGTTWTNITLSGLPNVPANCVVHEANNAVNPVFIGTDLGVYVIADTSTVGWTPFDNGLPNTIVNELEIQYSTQKLRAATYGRGMWETGIGLIAPVEANLSSLLSPVGTACTSLFNPLINVLNSGSNNITSMQIDYSIDGASQTFNWSGNITPTSLESITIPSITASTGNHTFTVTLTSVNGGSDANSSNNSRTSNFTVTSVAIPYFNDFESDITGWEHSVVPNGNNSAVDQWEHGVATGVFLNGAYSGTKTFTTDLDGSYEFGARNYLTSPCMDLTGMDHPMVRFRMSYDIEENWDAMYFEYSTDMKNTWIKLGEGSDTTWYSSEIAGDGVTAGTLCNGAQWTGQSLSFENYSHDLTNIAGQPNVNLRFHLATNNTTQREGVSIDNFEVLENEYVGIKKITKENANYSVYPSPTNGVIRVRYINQQNEELSIIVTNALGQTMETYNEKVNGSGNITLDLSAYPQGIYFVNITGNEQSTVKKVTLVK